MKAALKPSLLPWMPIWMPIWILLALACTLTPARAQTVAAFEPETLQTIEQSRGNKPYWLILWGLDCVYCVKSMQNLAALQKTHPKLNVITIATDSIDDSEALQQRLQSIGLKSTNYAFGNASSQALRHAIDPNWRGEKPRAYYYAPGQPRRLVIGVLDAARILGQ
jgi:thiol-disulfide isomerase/thioredoxin